jgi:uncharacterized membrane protein
MDGVKKSIFRSACALLAAGLLVAAAPAEARPPWVPRVADGPGMRGQASPALARILAQSGGRLSDAERERLRRDLRAAPRDYGRNGTREREARGGYHMTPQQRESLRRDMRDANRQLDRNPRRGRNGDRGRGSDRR